MLSRAGPARGACPLHRPVPTRGNNVANQAPQVSELKAMREELDAALKITYRTVDETCAILGISRRTYYRLVSDGKFTPLRLRGRTFVPHDQVVACLDEWRAVAGLRGALATSKQEI